MPEKVKLTTTEQDLLGQMARFAATRAANGVYMNQCYSKSVNAPMLIVVALGDQALALQQVIMRAAQPEIIEMPAARSFLADDPNGGNGGR